MHDPKIQAFIAGQGTIEDGLDLLQELHARHDLYLVAADEMVWDVIGAILARRDQNVIRFQVWKSGAAPTTRAVAAPAVTFGRAKTNHVVVEESDVAVHAVLVRHAGGVWLMNLHPHGTGVFRNQDRVDGARLTRHGDRVMIAETELRLL